MRATSLQTMPSLDVLNTMSLDAHSRERESADPTIRLTATTTTSLAQ
jgi:hypothetical protein